MTSILTLYMARHLGLAENRAIAGYQIFGTAAYAMPILGAILADGLLGRYRTILWLSWGYVAGHAVLALWETGTGLVVGLGLVAIGAGGIKANASAFAGDQIPAGKDALLARLYDLYYAMINVGSTLGTLIVPPLLDHVSPRVAFAVPGVAMAIALAVFWVGRRRYRHVEPARTRAAAPVAGRRGDWIAILRIAAVFAPISVFWALYFQYGSSWVLQAERMDRRLGGWTVSSGQLTTLNAVLLLLFLYVFAVHVFPALDRRGVRATALRKMTVGMFVMVLSFASAAAVQAALDGGAVPHVAWQVPQYAFAAVGEVLVSVTALEFAYSQAPARWKSFIMGLWYATIAAGQLLAAAVAWLNRFQGVAYYAFFAALMLGAAVVFAAVAWWYPAVPAGARAPEAT
jgi:POT family proton-dependent oligopeptide transporter